MRWDTENLHLTDFLDLATLQEIQDGFAAVANVQANITDADGTPLTQQVPTREFLQRQRAIAAAEENIDGPQREGRTYVAPIIVNDQRLGTIRMTPSDSIVGQLDEAKLLQLSQKFNLDFKQLKSLAASLMRSRTTRPASIQFLFLLANAIARLCYQEYQLRQRVEELSAVYNLSTMLTNARDLQRVLQRTVEAVADIMNVKGVSIRLVDEENDELIIKATHNLSDAYLKKGKILLSKSQVDQEAFTQAGFAYVKDMASDPRVLYPADAKREGIKSFLAVGMRYHGKKIGVLRLYTEHETTFTPMRINLLKAVAGQAAAAIENARLMEEALEAEALEKQVKMAADVQQRMIPHTPPALPNIDLAAVYVPCFELGGDLYDFITLPYQNEGLVIADVSGKGVPASLIMASVRAALRAQVDNVFYLDEVIRRLNVMLCRDNKPGEFVTLFYGVLDSNNRRLTYCNAGHPPGMLLRDGAVSELTNSNMVLGVSADETYVQSTFELRSGDVLLLYTDGLFDAVNFQGERFGRQRIMEAFAQGGVSAEAIAHNVLWTMRKFIGMTRRNDDVTMIVAKVN